MKKTQLQHSRSRAAAHGGGRRLSSGLTLIELMVALTIALFLIAGMVTILENIHTTYTNERELASLENNERLAMTLMTDVVQSAGYFPDPMSNSAGVALPASNNFPSNPGSPSLIGATNANGNDQFVVRFAAGAGNTSLMNCMGQTNSGAGEVSPYIDWESAFAVDGNGDLTCQVTNGATNAAGSVVTLVTGLATGQNGEPAGMTVLYGVDTGHTTPGSCMDTYMNAVTVTHDGYWGDVCTLKVTLTFLNPVPQPGGAQSYINFTRVIAVMNMTGMST